MRDRARPQRRAVLTEVFERLDEVCVSEAVDEVNVCVSELVVSLVV